MKIPLPDRLVDFNFDKTNSLSFIREFIRPSIIGTWIHCSIVLLLLLVLLLFSYACFMKKMPQIIKELLICLICFFDFDMEHTRKKAFILRERESEPISKFVHK